MENVQTYAIPCSGGGPAHEFDLTLNARDVRAALARGAAKLAAVTCPTCGEEHEVDLAVFRDEARAAEEEVFSEAVAEAEAEELAAVDGDRKRFNPERAAERARAKVKEKVAAKGALKVKKKDAKKKATEKSATPPHGAAENVRGRKEGYEPPLPPATTGVTDSTGGAP